MKNIIAKITRDFTLVTGVVYDYKNESVIDYITDDNATDPDAIVEYVWDGKSKKLSRKTGDDTGRLHKWAGWPETV